ncbi:MAG: hypothetical protein RL215_2551 [Planctomycetota bacterium]
MWERRLFLLFLWDTGFRFSVGGEDLEGVDAGSEWVIAGPDDFAFRSDFDHRDTGVGGMAPDDSISIGQSLAATGVAEEAIDIVVVDFPDDIAVLVQFHDFVAVSEGDEGVAVIESDGGEGPVFGRSAADGFEIGAEGVCDLASGSVFLDGEGEQVWDEEVAVAELAGHTGLHVRVVGFGLQWDFVGELA